jgi:hypothetical protein
MKAIFLYKLVWYSWGILCVSLRVMQRYLFGPARRKQVVLCYQERRRRRMQQGYSSFSSSLKHKYKKHRYCFVCSIDCFPMSMRASFLLAFRLSLPSTTKRKKQYSCLLFFQNSPVLLVVYVQFWCKEGVVRRKELEACSVELGCRLYEEHRTGSLSYLGSAPLYCYSRTLSSVMWLLRLWKNACRSTVSPNL